MQKLPFLCKKILYTIWENRLPDAAQAAALSGHRIQLVPFQFVADFLRETPLVLSDAHTYLPALLDRTVLQVVCNILMLMPFGMYLRYVCGLDLGRVALASLAFSAFIELGQLTGLFFVFRGSYRLCDVDDLMLNTLGGLLGGELVHALEAYLPPLDAITLSSTGIVCGESVTCTLAASGGRDHYRATSPVRRA